MTSSHSPEDIITQFKSQPVGLSEVELVKIVETLQEPSRSRGVVVGFTLSSIAAISIAAFVLLMPTAPRVNEVTPTAQKLPNERSLESTLGSEPDTKPTEPKAISTSEAIEPIQPRFGQCVLLTPLEIADLGVEVTDSSIILRNGVNASEYLKEYSRHRFGETASGSTSYTQIEPTAIVSESGFLLSYRTPLAQPEQIPVRHDSNERQIVELRIHWDDPKREQWLRESKDEADNSDSPTAFRYIFMTKEQTDSFRIAARQQTVQARINIINGVAAGRLIPLKIRLARINSSSRTPDITLWYKPTEDFLQKLPPGFASAIRNELRGSGNSCTYTTTCLENGATVELANVQYDPASDLINLECSSAKSQQIVFSLFNTIGVPVGSVTIEAPKGMNNVRIPVAQGNYGLILLSAKTSSGEHVASRVFIGPR